MPRIAIDPGYSDTYSDSYEGSVGDVWLYVEMAFNPPTEEPDWVDLTNVTVGRHHIVRSVSTKRGRSSESDTFSAGQATVVLDNRDRRFDPSYTGSPYYPNVKPKRRLRISIFYNGVRYYLFTGFTDGFPQEYRNPADGFVQVTAHDALALFALADAPHPFVQLDDETGGILDKAKLAGPTDVIAETTGARLQRVLDGFEWSDYALDDGRSMLPAGQGTGNGLSYMQSVAVTEDGRLFVSGDGTVTFLDRHAPFLNTQSTTSQGTFGDGAGELRYSDIVLPDEDDQIRNDVRVRFAAANSQRASESEVGVEDADSIAEFFRHSYERSVLYTDPVEAQNLAEYILNRFKEPFVRVDALKLTPLRDPSGLIPQAAGREIGDRVTVKRRPQGVGSAITVEALIEGVSHQFPLGAAWSTTFNLSPADTQPYLILDSADAGLLETNLLGY